jgi:DNA-binding PadR family transcriptional regulator
MTQRVSAPVLGEFELLVLLAVLKLGDGAYPLAIADEIERTSDRKASRPAVLITLNRLEDKGLLTSRYQEATSARSGNRRRLFSPKTLAIKAVKASLRRIRNLSRGLEPLLELPS